MKLHTSLCLTSVYLSLALLLSCGGDEKAQREIIRPVRFQQVFLSGSVQNRTFSGVAKAGTEADLSFRVGGIVEMVNVKIGDKIKTGNLIAAIDDSDARLNYEKALSALQEAETQKLNAKSNLDRVKQLYENNNVSLNEYEAAKSRYASANSAYDTAKKNVDLKQRELGYYKLLAPIDGVISEVTIEKNENANPGQVVAKISSEDDIEVTVGLPEAFISRVSTGEEAKIRFSSFPDKIFDGAISEVSFAAGSQASTFPVIVKLQHPTNDVRPGMPADVTFQFTSGEQQKRLLVPLKAVGEDVNGNFVFTVIETEEGLARVQKKQVTVGDLTREGFEILSGLQDGEFVVTAGIEHLSDSMKVRMLK